MLGVRVGGDVVDEALVALVKVSLGFAALFGAGELDGFFEDASVVLEWGEGN